MCAALGVALAAGSALAGALTMLAFGLGIAPMMLRLGSAAAALSRAARRPRVRDTAGLAVGAVRRDEPARCVAAGPCGVAGTGSVDRDATTLPLPLSARVCAGAASRGVSYAVPRPSGEIGRVTRNVMLDRRGIGAAAERILTGAEASVVGSGPGGILNNRSIETPPL